jgi:F-type H+-transporting ATPase subunit b
MAALSFAAEEAHGGGEDHTVAKWLYAAALVAILVFAWRKYVTPALASRGDSIRKDIDSARKMKAEADARVQEIESRLSNLSGEVEAFRADAQRLIEAEGEKIRAETEDMAARIRQRTEREIEALTKGALASVRAEAAQQAVELARQRIAQGLTPETHRGLVSGFLQDLEGSRN